MHGSHSLCAIVYGFMQISLTAERQWLPFESEYSQEISRTLLRFLGSPMAQRPVLD